MRPPLVPFTTSVGRIESRRKNNVVYTLAYVPLLLVDGDTPRLDHVESQVYMGYQQPNYDESYSRSMGHLMSPSFLVNQTQSTLLERIRC